MSYESYFEKLNYLKWLIESVNTGTSQHISDKLGVSERTVKRMIGTLREQGYNITYCRKKRRYYVEKK